MKILDNLVKRVEFNAIAIEYKDKKAFKSQQSYMKHILEGVLIIDYLSGKEDDPLMEYALHPVFQSDEAMLKIDFNSCPYRSISKQMILHCMEYRKIANAYNIKDELKDPSKIILSPISSVNLMLMGDKIQNKKDFLDHVAMHPDYQSSKDHALAYFNSWLSALGISDEKYLEVSKYVDQFKDTIDDYIKRIYEDARVLN